MKKYLIIAALFSLVAAESNNASITLEPGGQIELSGSPLKSLFETCREVNSHQKELDNYTSKEQLMHHQYLF